jgi:hypothetical protein
MFWEWEKIMNKKIHPEIFGNVGYIGIIGGLAALSMARTLESRG